MPEILSLDDIEAPETISLEDIEPPPKTTVGGAIARSAATSVLPGIAFGQASRVGAPISAVATPWVGVPAGIIAGAGAAFGAEYLQRKGLEAVSPEAAEELAQLQAADIEQHPWASATGRLIGGLGGFRLSPGSVFKATPAQAATQIAAGTALGVALPIATEALRTGEVRAPTVPEVTEAAAFSVLYGQPRGTRAGAPAARPREIPFPPEALPTERLPVAEVPIEAPRQTSEIPLPAEARVTPTAPEQAIVPKEPWEMTKTEGDKYLDKNLINAVKTDKGRIIAKNVEHGDLMPALEESGSTFKNPNARGWAIVGKKPSESYIGVADLEPAQGDFHKAYVIKALKAGKTVPPEVLADYPDLQLAKEPVPAEQAPPPKEAPEAAGEVTTAVAETPAAAPLAEATPEAIPAQAAAPLRIEALGLSEADLTPGKIKAMPASNPEQWATVKKYFGVKGVKEAQSKIAARFEQMREAAQPKEPSETQIQKEEEVLAPAEPTSTQEPWSWRKVPSVTKGGKPHFWNRIDPKENVTWSVVWNRALKKWEVRDTKNQPIDTFSSEERAKQYVEERTQPTPPVTPSESIGPGAASPAEFEQIRAEADKGVFTRLVDWIKSKRIPDNPNIKEAVSKRDVMAGRQWINSPEYLFRKDPVAGPLVSHIVEAQLRHNDRASRDEIHFQEITKNLDEPSMKRVTSALRMQEAGESNPFAILRPEERAVAQEIRTYFDQWKERLRTQKAQKIIDALPDARRRTIEAIQAGESFDAAAKAHKLRGAGKEGVRLALKEIEEARKWGIENYVTHAEQGSWRIVTEDGTTVAIGETKAEAYQKAEAYLKENPGAGKLTLDDSFDPGFDWPSQLTPPAYGKLLQNLQKATGEAAKELQAALRKTAPGIVIKPTSKYSRFLTKRYGVLKGEENISDVLPSYIYSMWKKQELDPVLKEARGTMPKLGAESRSAVEALLADVKGQKYLGDKIVDHVLSGASDLVEKATGFSLPVKPFGFSKGVNVLRNISAHLKLGYRPISVLINRLGGIQHTWTKTGFADFLEGRRWIKTEEGQRLAKENEAEMGLTAAFVTEGRLSREEPWYKPLGLFQKMEHFNRPEAFGAFYVQATKRLGLTGQEAVQYANRATRFAQFTYNTAALPKIMRGPVGRLVFQFKPYLVKELEFISSLRGAELGRYATGFLALGGPRAAVIMLKSLPILGAMGAIRELEDWMNQQTPQASRGVAGAVGADISAAAAPQLPSTAGEWAGPVLNDYIRLWNEVINPAMKGEAKDWSDVKNWATRTAPALFYMNQAVESVLGEQGWVTDARGRHQFQPSKWDKAKLMLGVTPLDKSIQQSEQRYLLETEAIQRKNRQHWLDNVVDAMEQNNEKRLNALMEDAPEFYASQKDFQKALKYNVQQRATEPRERLFKRLSKMTRMQEAERFSE